MRTGCGALAFRPPHKEKSRIRPRGDGNPRNQEEREAKEGIKLLFKFSKFFLIFPIDKPKKWWYIIVAIGSEELSRRMEERASV